MDKAFFINGGAGRVMCAIPALEKYAKNNPDENFIVVAEGWMEVFAGSPVLRDRTFHVMHNRLFEDHLLDKEIVSPEPYRVNEYYNQKANLIQAFDILINGRDDVLKASTKITCELSKKEQVDGHCIVNDVRKAKNKEKVIVFQPFGSTVTQQTNFIFDSSGRSFELADTIRLIDELKKDYGIILMSQLPVPMAEENAVAWPQNLNTRQWMGIINAADHFFGCDSLGQHIAYALNKPATVVIGATFPENISYQDEKNFQIIDVGKKDRRYSPIRITMDDSIDRSNEALMVLKEEHFKLILDSIRQKLGSSSKDLKSKLGAR
jgi:hypothetical protein